MQLLLWYGRNDGIPIVSTALSGEDIYQKRNSVEECLEFINKDLDDVISITDDEICPFLWDEGNRSRMSRSSALALKMDLNLQFKRYDVAKEAAKKLIDSGAFELYSAVYFDNDIGIERTAFDSGIYFYWERVWRKDNLHINHASGFPKSI